MSEVDWLSHLLQIITVTGQLEVRCAYGAPWRIAWSQAAANEIPYHVIVNGRAILEDPETRTVRELVSGDVVLLPHGAAHVLHDGSKKAPISTHERQASAGWMLSENDGQGEQLDLLCGRFFITPPHDRLICNYMPASLVARSANGHGEEGGSASNQLASVVGLMLMESARDFVDTVHARSASGERTRRSSRRPAGPGGPSAAGASHRRDVRRSRAILEIT